MIHSGLFALALLTQMSSPISWYSELKAGKYRPAVDDEFDGSATPYADIFGTDRRLTWRLSFEHRIIGGFGTIYAGGDVGFFYISGKALASDGTKSEDDTALWVMPMSVRASYRFDYLVEKWSFPLVPYVRAGLVYAPWWITKSDGAVASWGDGSGKARGATTGWEAAFGVSLLLDLFEPTAARTMDHEWGVNHTYIFGEYNHLVLDGFGDGKSLILSDDHWFFGIAMEY